ncbi:MAG: ribonuclease HI family protein [Nanoarchaeota archaeon]
MIITNSDGGSRGNPGQAAIGIIIRDEDKILKTYKEKIGTATNNEAEYRALIKALNLASKYTKSKIQCILDSELVVKQLKGSYSISSDILKPLFITVKELEKNFKHVEYKHVRREDKYQKLADRLVNEALDGN